MSNNAEPVNEVVEAPKGKAKGGRKSVNATTVASSVATTSAITNDATPSISQLVDLIEELKTRIIALEDTVTTLKSAASNVSNAPSKSSKPAEEKKPRAPTAYNLFMKEKMSELKEQHPEMSNIDRMKMAAEAWSESKK